VGDCALTPRSAARRKHDVCALRFVLFHLVTLARSMLFCRHATQHEPKEREEEMTKKIRITTLAVGASLAGVLLLGAAPAAAGDATLDADAADARNTSDDAEQERFSPLASAMAAAPAGTDAEALGTGSGEARRADTRHPRDLEGAGAGSGAPAEASDRQQRGDRDEVTYPLPDSDPVLRKLLSE
jgi:hypothetical protein